MGGRKVDYVQQYVVIDQRLNVENSGFSIFILFDLANQIIEFFFLKFWG